MQTGFENIHHNLRAYKQKYYLNALIRGSILAITCFLAAYYALTALAYYGNLPSWLRGVLFYTSLAGLGYGLFVWVLEPVFRIIALRKQLSDEEAAIQIGALIPEIKDKLLNTLQLSKMDATSSDLLQAALEKKSNELSVFNFSSTIKIDQNKRYLPYLIPSLLAGIVLFLLIPQLFTEGTERIVKYNTEFIPQAPFTFNLVSTQLEAFKDEDVTVQLRLEGRSLPDDAFVFANGLRQKMDKLSATEYAFTFRSLKEAQSFRFEASGFYSKSHLIDVKYRPVLNFFDVKLEYPAYLGRTTERLSNAGNLLVPQGTKIQWLFNTKHCNELDLQINERTYPVSASLTQGFSFTYQALQSGPYQITLRNSDGANKDKIAYTISVITDEYPKIGLEQFKDTVLFSNIIFGGTLTDDYGLTALALFYKRGSDPQFVQKPIKIAKGQNNQNYYYKWHLDSLALSEGETLEYYLAVWDNDGINGPKMSKTSYYQLKVPSATEVVKSISESSEKAEQQIETTLNKAEDLKKDMKKLEQRLKTKKNLDWQDRKSIEEMLKKHEEMQREIEQMNKKHEELMQKQDRFDKTNERIAEKTKLLQQLMNEVLDDETKKMYQEMAKLLQEKGKENELKDLVEKLAKKEQNIEKELDRALEMFKQLKVESKIEEVTNKVQELAKKQEELAKESETTSPKDEKAMEMLKKEQEALNEQFEEVKKEMQDLKEMNEELENKKELDNTDQEQKDISNEQKQSTEQLDKKDSKNASKSQKNAADKMKKMAQKLDQMQEKNEMEMAEENKEDLRQILDNLITLSYGQEEIMKEFKKVNQQDPRFIELSQKQLKLKDDSKIIEDSLYALSKRVFQIQAFIKKELEDMNRYMDEAGTAIKARRPDLASGKQQFAMTSMNNLALMLSDVLQQMQENMQDQKMSKGGGSGKGKKKQCSSGKPSLSQMQKSLNKQLSELKKSGLSGSKLSEQLAKMARQQEQIRKAMQQEGKGNSTGEGESGKPGGNEGTDGKEGKGKEQGQGESEKIKEEMEMTEKDLVNKRLSDELLQRQEEILTRLLEHERAQRERELDNKREAEQSKNQQRSLPPALEQKLKEKELQLDLLRTIPPNLSPYYKREAGEYFEKLND